MDQGIPFLRELSGMLAIVNPIGAAPVFVGLTEGQSPAVRRRTAVISAVAVGTALLVTMLLGESILGFFGIGIDSFRVGGGILIVLMALSMLHARPSGVRHTPEEASACEASDAVAVVPIAVEFIATGLVGLLPGLS